MGTENTTTGAKRDWRKSAVHWAATYLRLTVGTAQTKRLMENKKWFHEFLELIRDKTPEERGRIMQNARNGAYDPGVKIYKVSAQGIQRVEV